MTDPRGLREHEALPPVVSVVGYKDTGKTGVAVALVAELRRRGHDVGAVKHGHGFRIDTPGTDSWRLRNEGGANPVLLVGPEGFWFMGAWGPGGEPELDALLRTHFGGCGVVVVEGFKTLRFPKVEVHRADAHPELIYRPGAPQEETFLAIVTDDLDLRVPIPVLSLEDPTTPSRLADMVEAEVIHAPGLEDEPAWERCT